MSKESNPILGAIDNINSAFEEFKKTNDELIDAMAKGNTAKAAELGDKLERIEEDIIKNEKEKRDAERKSGILSERVELLEALNDRPKGTIQDKLRSEHKDAFMDWFRAGGKDNEADARMRAVAKNAR